MHRCAGAGMMCYCVNHVAWLVHVGIQRCGGNGRVSLGNSAVINQRSGKLYHAG